MHYVFAVGFCDIDPDTGFANEFVLLATAFDESIAEKIRLTLAVDYVAADNPNREFIYKKIALCNTKFT